LSWRGIRSISRRGVFNRRLALSDRRGGRRRGENCRSRMGRCWAHVRCGSGGWRVLYRPRGGDRADQRGGRRRGCSPDGWSGDRRGKHSGSWRKSRDRCRWPCFRVCGGKCRLNPWCLWCGSLRDRDGCGRGLAQAAKSRTVSAIANILSFMLVSIPCSGHGGILSIPGGTQPTVTDPFLNLYTAVRVPIGDAPERPVGNGFTDRRC